MNHAFCLFVMWLIGAAFTFGIVFKIAWKKDAGILVKLGISLGLAILWPPFWFFIGIWLTSTYFD